MKITSFLFFVAPVFLVSSSFGAGYKLELKPQLPLAGDSDHAPLSESAQERNQRMKWWRDAKLGMFIHYGLYSGLAGEWKGKPGGSEWIQKNVEVDTLSYEKEAIPLFKPRKEAPHEWIALASQVGCQYAVMTTKHHDGFGLFDSKQSDYNVKARFQVDLVKEFTTACQEKGLKTGFYHSVIDWHHPQYDPRICPELCYPKGQIQHLKEQGKVPNHAAYQQYLHSQVEELMTQYGKVDILWWDYSQGAMQGQKGWEAPRLMQKVRAYHPGIIMNNRLYAYSGLDCQQSGSLDLRCGDFTTPENFIPEKGYPSDWEACMTVSEKWGYNRYDTQVKSPEVLIQKLVECVTKGGNLLLNINPKADGSIPEAVEKSLRGLGDWVQKHKEAIFGTRAYLGLGAPASINEKGEVFLFIQKETELVLPEGKTKAFNISTQEEVPLSGGKTSLTPPQNSCQVIKLS